MRFLFSYSILLLLIICSCEPKKNSVLLDANNPDLVLDNGTLRYNNVPFEGQLTSKYNNYDTTKSIVTYVNGRKNGIEKIWHPNGQLAILRHYKNGLKAGLHEGWWENGSQKFKYQFNDEGAYNGNLEEWYPTGQQSKVFHYENGKEKGNQKLWKTDGSIKANYTVKNGERFGLIGLKKCFTVTKDSNELQ